MDDGMENQEIPESVDGNQMDHDVRGELPHWYIRYLAHVFEWEENLKECCEF